ncbi:MAG TPA: hypothetical protein VGJ91_17120, partial [Polyangiaceae bacterium]
MCNFLGRHWEFRLSSPATGYKTFARLAAREAESLRNRAIEVRPAGDPRQIQERLVTLGVRAFGLMLLITTGCQQTPASAPQADALAPAPPPTAAHGGTGGTAIADAPSAPGSSSAAGASPSSVRDAAQGGSGAQGGSSPAPLSARASEERAVKG